MKQRYSCWSKFYRTNIAYRKECAKLSVSDKHVTRDASASFKVGDQVAKEFQQEIFYGEITGELKKENWWHVRYEDGDEEDLDLCEVREARKLYLYYQCAQV